MKKIPVPVDIAVTTVCLLIILRMNANRRVKKMNNH